MPRETNKELIGRYKTVAQEYEKAKARAERTQSPSTRSRRHRWAGCLNFVKLQCESEMRERGLMD